MPTPTDACAEASKMAFDLTTAPPARRRGLRLLCRCVRVTTGATAGSCRLRRSGRRSGEYATGHLLIPTVAGCHGGATRTRRFFLRCGQTSTTPFIGWRNDDPVKTP
jgi:hypothetical protein